MAQQTLVTRRLLGLSDPTEGLNMGLAILAEKDREDRALALQQQQLEGKLQKESDLASLARASISGATPVERSSALSELAAVDPARAESVQKFQEFQQRLAQGESGSSIESMVQGAATALASANPLSTLISRREQLSARGIPTFETDQAISVFQNEGEEAGRQLLRGVVDSGVEFGVVKGVTPEKVTSLQQNLMAAGLQPGTQEFKQALLTSMFKPQTSVTVGDGERAERKEIGKVQAKRFEKILEEGDTGRTLLGTLNQISEIDVKTGLFEPTKLAFGRAAEALGFDSSEFVDVTSAEALNALSNRLVNDVLNSAKGPQTDQDAERARSTIRSLGDDPKAGMFKIKSLKSAAERQIERADFISRAVDDEDKSVSEANRDWREFINKTPNVSPKLKDEDGLPMFWNDYEDQYLDRNPGSSRSDALKAWRANKPLSTQSTKSVRIGRFTIEEE